VKVRAPFDAMNLAARLGQGDLVKMPRRRITEEPRPISADDRWSFGRGRRTA